MKKKKKKKNNSSLAFPGNKKWLKVPSAKSFELGGDHFKSVAG